MSLHELTAEHRDFAENHHNLVYAFLHGNSLRADDFYDIVIMGYLYAVQVYCDREDLREKYAFSTIAWNQMSYKLKNYYKQQSCPMRKAVTVSLEAMIYDGDGLMRNEVISEPDHAQEQLDAKLLWEEVSGLISGKQAELLHMRADGYTTREIAIKKGSKCSDVEAVFADIQECLTGFSLA